MQTQVQTITSVKEEKNEATVVVLGGGQFNFPKNTVLVSAVYFFNDPKLSLRQIEIQHCVDLTGRPGLSKYLKFAIAPLDKILPYQFRIIEGGEFSSDSRYGSIQLKECVDLVCILGEETTNGVHVTPTDKDTDEEEEQEQQQQQEEEDEEEEEQQKQHQKEEAREEDEQQHKEEEKDKQQQNGKDSKEDETEDDSSVESNKTINPPVASSGAKG